MVTAFRALNESKGFCVFVSLCPLNPHTYHRRKTIAEEKREEALRHEELLLKTPIEERGRKEGKQIRK